MDARGWTPKQALLELEGWRAGGRRLRKSGSPDLRRARFAIPALRNRAAIHRFRSGYWTIAAAFPNQVRSRCARVPDMLEQKENMTWWYPVRGYAIVEKAP